MSRRTEVAPSEVAAAGLGWRRSRVTIAKPNVAASIRNAEPAPRE